MTGGFGEAIYNPGISGYGPSKFELMLGNRLYRYILGLIVYIVVTLIVYVIFRIKKHEYPFMDALKISWIRGIIIVFILYNLYMIFVGTSCTCAYSSLREDPIIKLWLLDIGFIFFMVIVLILYFKEFKGNKKTLDNIKFE